MRYSGVTPLYLVYKAEEHKPDESDPDVLRFDEARDRETGEDTYLVMRFTTEPPDPFDDSIGGFAQALAGDTPLDTLDRMFLNMAARYPESDWADAVREVLGE